LSDSDVGSTGDTVTDDAGAPNPVAGGGTASRRAGLHRGTRARPSNTRRAVEWLVIIAIAVLVALGLRVFVFQTFYIPSGSMYPTLKVNDRILVNKLSYRFHGVGRGDIIVFRAPPRVEGACETMDKVLVKRVIGLPGETISAHNDDIYIDGKEIAQPWLPKHDPNTNTPAFGPISIPANNYFVMGDNRTMSCDSRSWGTVTRSEIIGKAEMRIWPLGRLGFF
jgi:signal peptidase I